MLKILDRQDNDVYKLSANNVIQFDVVVKCNENNLFFRQNQESVCVSCETRHNLILIGVSVHTAS